MESYVIMHIYVQEGIVFKVFVDRGNVVKKLTFIIGSARKWAPYQAAREFYKDLT